MLNFEQIYDEGGKQMVEEKYKKRIEELETLKADFAKRKQEIEKEIEKLEAEKYNTK